MIPALPFDVQRLIILQAAESFEFCPHNIWSSRTRALGLVELALVNKDWKDVIYPIIYSSVNYNFDAKKSDVNLLSRTLADSPSIRQLVQSLRVEGWDWHTFNLVPNLRFFECLGHVFPEDETVETMDVKLKLKTLKVSPFWQGAWSCPCDGSSCEVLDDFEKCVDPSELHTLVVDLSMNDPFYNIPAFVIFPTVPLPSLTTVLIFHTLTFNNDDGPLPHLYYFLKRFGPTLLHLSLHEVTDNGAQPEGSVLPYELFAAVPNLLTLTISGTPVAADDFQEGHPKLEEIIVGRELGPWTPEGISDEEAPEPGWMDQEEAKAVEMILVGAKAAEGGATNAYPRMKTIRMSHVLFDAEEETDLRYEDEEYEDDDDEEVYEGMVGELCAKVQAMGWELRDAKGRTWEEAGCLNDRVVGHW